MANFTQELKDLLPIDSIKKLNDLFSLLNRRRTVIGPHIDRTIFKFLTDNDLRILYCKKTRRTLKDVLSDIKALEKPNDTPPVLNASKGKAVKVVDRKTSVKGVIQNVPLRKPSTDGDQNRIKRRLSQYNQYVDEGKGPRLQKNDGLKSLRLNLDSINAFLSDVQAVNKITEEQKAKAEAYKPEPKVSEKVKPSVTQITKQDKESTLNTEKEKKPEEVTRKTTRNKINESLIEIVEDLASCADARTNSGVSPIARVHCLYDDEGETFWFTNRNFAPRELDGLQEFGRFVPKYSDVAIKMQKSKVGTKFDYSVINKIKRLQTHHVRLINQSDIQNQTIAISGDKHTYQYRDIHDFLETLRQNQAKIKSIESDLSALEKQREETTSHEKGQVTNTIKKKEEEYRILTQQQEDLKNITIYIRKQGEMRYSLIVDPIQTSIMEKHLYDGKTVVIKGGPGTGKTTTMIHRLAYLTDTFAIKEDESNKLDKYKLTSFQRRQLLEAIKDNRDWIFFSPSQMLKDYLADAMKQEGLTHTAEKVWNWRDYCRMVLRDYYHLLGAEGDSTPFYVSHSSGMLFYQNSNLIQHFKNFFIGQLQEIKSTLPVLSSDGKVYEWKSIADNIQKRFEDVDSYDLAKFVTLFNSLESLYNADCRRILRERNNAVSKLAEKICALFDKNDKAKKELKEILELTVDELNENSLEDIESDVEESKSEPITSKIQKRIHSLLRNEPQEHELAGEIQKWIKAYSYSKISQKELSDEHDLMADVILPLIEDKFTDDIRRIGELMVFEQFAQYTRGVRSIMLNTIPSRYKKFRSYLIKTKFESCDLKLLREIMQQNQGKELHFQEQALLLGFINNMVKNIKASGSSKTRHDYIEAYEEVSRPIIGIDEVTDFSICEIYAMNSLLTREFSSLTLCGDMMQGMTTYGIKKWDELDSVIANQAPFEMKTSYRQSKKLLELAINLSKDTLEETPNFKAYMKSSRVPAPLAYINENELYKIEWISKRIEEVNRAYAGTLPSIAIFVTDKGYIPHFIENLQATEFFKSNGIKIYDGTIANGATDKHICIYPISEVKGMEFDVVFFHNIDKTYAERDLLKKYIYVGLSRAAFFLGITLVEEDTEICRYFSKDKDWFNI